MTLVNVLMNKTFGTVMNKTFGTVFINLC